MDTGKKKAFKTILEQIDQDFINESAQKITRADVDTLVAHADEIREEFADGPLSRFRREGEQLISLLEDYRVGAYPALPYWTLSVVAFTLAYVLKPVDIIPDSLPAIGQLDDAIVVSFCIDMVRPDLDAYRAWVKEANA